MCSNNKILVIFLPGYKSNSHELQFLRDFIEKKIGIPPVYLPYQLIKGNNERLIKQISKELAKQIKSLLLKHQFSRCYLVGYSLGAALALDIAVDCPGMFSGLILISIFDDRVDLLLNRGIILAKENNIRPVSLIKKIKRTNILFIHGSSDRSISIERAIKVFEKGSKKYSKFISIPSDHHFGERYSKTLLNKSIGEFLKLTTD
jgi:predicted esterase